VKAELFITEADTPALPVWPVATGAVEDWCNAHAGPYAAWVGTAGFVGEAGRVLLLPDEAGGLAGALLGTGNGSDPFIYAALSETLPEGTYRFSGLEEKAARQATLAWALGAYSFDKYKTRGRPLPRLVVPDGVDREEIMSLAEAVILTRDLVNTPAGDFGPCELEAAARKVADRFGAEFSVLCDDELLAENYPMIHAVGRAAGEGAEPRLIDFTWGEPSDPKVTLVGKGVCFDTGGLNLKPGNSMGLMKKDMGGAAHVLALAQLIMGANLKLRLSVLIPAVENAVAGNAFRPGDVLQSRKGLTVEIGNTDAEGRLILADALCEADSEAPDLLIDMATLTGACLVALGRYRSGLLSNSSKLANALLKAGEVADDPAWRLPLDDEYKALLKTNFADLQNIGGRDAGTITERTTPGNVEHG